MICLGGAAFGCGSADRERTEKKAEVTSVSSETGRETASAADETATEAPQKSSEPPAGKNVLLIVVDTLRADRLGCYGYKDAPTTPTMDKLASEGVLFEHFYSAAPWTGASFGSMLTGTAPTVHDGGRRVYVGDEGKELMGLRVTPIRKEIPTLPELLTGFATGAVATNSFLHPDLGFGRGFDEYNHRSAGLSGSRRADQTTDVALRWIKAHKKERFFYMAHFFDPHMGYDPLPAYLKRFAPGPAGRIRVPFVQHAEARNGKLNPSETEKAFIRGLYNGEVRFVDDQIGRLLTDLKVDGVLENTWVVLTADHGEEQFDHKSFDHGHRYEDEVVHVPLIVRAPGGKWMAGKRVSQTARHIDIAPSILARMGLPPGEKMQGRDLLPLITGEETDNRPAYIEFNIYWTRRSALVTDGRYKIIRDVEGDYGWYYDLAEDPGEHKKIKNSDRYQALAKQLADVRTELTAEAARLNAAGGDNTPAALPDSVVESLKALGYLEE